MKIQKFRWFVLFLVLGIGLRLALIPFGNNPDILSLADWGRWIFKNGPLGFYETTGWLNSPPTQAPVFNILMGLSFAGYYYTLEFMRFLTFYIVPHLAPGHMLWWFEWVKWWEIALFSGTNYLYGHIMWVKIIPILADMVLAVSIYLIGTRNNFKISFWTSVLFMMLPFGWYLSALWGQYDQLVTLFLLLSFLTLYKRYFILSVFFLFIACEIKATAGLYVPFYLFYFIYKRPSPLSIIASIVSIVGAFWITLEPFTKENPFTFFQTVVYPQMFYQERWAIATHTFNFWQFFYPQIERRNLSFLFIPITLWSYLFLTIIYGFAFMIVRRKNDFVSLISSLYIVGAGTYIFGTAMLDRYFHPAVFFLALLTVYYPKLMKYWIITSSIYFLNLFYSWGFPFLSIDLVWKYDLVVYIFSTIQVIVFFMCIQTIYPNAFNVVVKRSWSDIVPLHKLGVNEFFKSRST
jgi:Gpi18-like mannosyltransferase